MKRSDADLRLDAAKIDIYQSLFFGPIRSYSSRPVSSPAKEFLQEREKAGDNLIQAYVGLLDSNVPLDQSTRSGMAVTFALLAGGKTAIKQMEMYLFKVGKRHNMEDGMRAPEAEAVAARALRKSAAAIKQQIKRAKRKQRRGPDAKRKQRRARTKMIKDISAQNQGHFSEF